MLSHFAIGYLNQILTIERNTAGGKDRRGGHDAGDCADGCGLAAARHSDNTHHRTSGDVEADPVDSANAAACGAIVDYEIAYF